MEKWNQNTESNFFFDDINKENLLLYGSLYWLFDEL